MFANERYPLILEMLEKRGAVTVAELINRFGVSMETVRRDLSYLEREGSLKRVHGGAVALTKMNAFHPLTQRRDENKTLKQELSVTAAGLIREGDVVALDAGSTALVFAGVLKEKFHHLRIVTYSLEIIEFFKNDSDFEIFSIGGQFFPQESSFYGSMALDAIQRLHFSKAFIFPSAVSLEHGIGDYVPEMSMLQAAFMERSRETVIMADSSKFEVQAFLTLSDLNPAYIYVTDSRLSPEIYKLYRKNQIRLYNHPSQLTQY